MQTKNTLDITNFHAKYYALELLQKNSNDDNRLTETLFNSTLEINPHQIDAALFALKSPFSKGVLLADEVGLGKTIEAGLVISQYFAEQKTKQMVICPASLRKQWALELSDKFNVDSFILEARSLEEFKTYLNTSYFNNDKVIIISYNYASKIEDELSIINWDLVIIDEAHKLRNSHRESNKTGQNIKRAIGDSKKLLLTATPLQNNVIELYGLVSVIDEYIFGDIKSFRELYCNNIDSKHLQNRLRYFSKRTLRKDVKEYVNYTNRKGIQQRFKSSPEEQKLYNDISSFLQQDNTYAFPQQQKVLATLIIRKVLASSTSAIITTLEAIKTRLENIKNNLSYNDDFYKNILDDDEYEILLEEQDELDLQEDRLLETDDRIDLVKLTSEITFIDNCIQLALSITADSKSYSLLDALKIGFEEIDRLKGNKKALIFTESRRTQDYLKEFLEQNGYKDKIVLFNGQNSSKQATEIYNNWFEKNKYTDKISQSKVADKRNALIEYFKDTAEICIATEAAAEGVNLQFCSLVINYDLPWNPQRIEQRIGRCHRYGQKNDVVVINFINESNIADVRVAQLLDEKFQLFDGVFGASDDVLGIIENGIDFEKRIFSIYQDCRTPDEIQLEFDALQKELEGKIKQTMHETQNKLFENFDIAIHEKLHLSIHEHLDRYKRLFWALNKFVLNDYITVNEKDKTFVLNKKIENFICGQYSLLHTNKQSIQLRTNHPVGKYVLEQAKNLTLSTKKIVFDITNNSGHKLSAVEQLKGKSGFLSLSKLSISSVTKDDFLLFCGFEDDGTQLLAETCKRMFDCIGYEKECVINDEWIIKLKNETEIYAEGTILKVNDANATFIRDEEDRLDKWKQDMIISLETELKNIKKSILEIERLSRHATSTAEKIEYQEKLQSLNKKKRKARNSLEDNEEELDEKRATFINNMRKQVLVNTNLEHIFSIVWEVI